ncbi:hypothetical protein [Nocardia sp. BMG111209]|uniref:hypothetical protein n=1 Tax=Nocardia sp. BMG111209 TaxID=1160137 RepID=UPI00037705A4|nr:hypothetical protein [Nocardia sp. BMG111209]
MLFDIRTIVGALLGIYGIILTGTGLINDTTADQDRTGGWNINLWAGIGLIVVAILFLTWVRLRPVEKRRVAHDGTEPVPAGSDAPAGEKGTRGGTGEPGAPSSRPADDAGTTRTRPGDEPGTSQSRPDGEPGSAPNRLSE